MFQFTPAPALGKTCVKCQEFKPLEAFTRRRDGYGDGYRTDCKACVAKRARASRADAPRARARREAAARVPAGHKKCSKCTKIKPVAAFIVRRETGKPRNPCRDCMYRANHDRYHLNPEYRSRHKARTEQWRAANPDFFAEYYRANREKAIANAIEYARRNPPNPEQVRRWARERYAADPEKHRAKNKTWRQNNLERAREVGRRAQSRRRAQLRGLPFEDYTLDQILERDGSLCVLCGEELDLAAEHPDLLAATVEHLECISWPDSAGDVLLNVAAAHFTCNSSRNNRPHPAAARKRAELLAAEHAVVAG